MQITQTSEPKRLTRGDLGNEFRIVKLYGFSVLGLRTFLRYLRATGRRNEMLETALANAEARGLRPFDCTTGVRAKVRAFSESERARRERWAREERAGFCS